MPRSSPVPPGLGIRESDNPFRHIGAVMDVSLISNGISSSLDKLPQSSRAMILILCNPGDKEEEA
jgi:hypothetical protein